MLAGREGSPWCAARPKSCLSSTCSLIIRPPQHHHPCDHHHSDGDGDFLWQLYTFPDKRLYRVKECEPGGYLGSKRGHHSGIPTAFD